MTPHTPVALSDEYKLRKHLGAAYKQACWTCGKIFPAVSKYCETYLTQYDWRWGPGQPEDPFASMRTNVAGGASAGQALGSQGVGAHGMPIRDPGHTHHIYVPESSPPAAAGPAEKRPGLVSEEIDRKAYDEFMKGL